MSEKHVAFTSVSPDLYGRQDPGEEADALAPRAMGSAPVLVSQLPRPGRQRVAVYRKPRSPAWLNARAFA